jgi:hypothetical protein
MNTQQIKDQLIELGFTRIEKDVPKFNAYTGEELSPTQEVYQLDIGQSVASVIFNPQEYGTNGVSGGKYTTNLYIQSENVPIQPYLDLFLTIVKEQLKCTTIK